MIVPRMRFILAAAVALLPCALLRVVLRSGTPLLLFPALLLLIAALLDAVLAHSALDGIQVELPDIVRLHKDREGELELTVRHERSKPGDLRIGLPFPPEIATDYDDIRVRLTLDVPAARLAWPCTPSRRGVFPLHSCYLERPSPLGFWGFRAITPLRSEIRVYPNLLTERQHLSALFLPRGGFGIHAQRQVGKGREFEKLREYIPGDSFDDIHWKATAKRRHPITKVFQIERTQEVYVVLDASRLSARRASGSHDSVLERFITAALVMGLAAKKQGDQFGVVTFSDQVQGFVRAKAGTGHYNICREALFALQPQTVNPDFEELGAFLRLRLRRRALLVILTNLDDPMLAERFSRNIDLLCRQHLVLVNVLRPHAAYPLFSRPDAASLDDLYRHLGGHILWHDLQELKNTLHHKGVRFTLVDHENLCLDLVSQYMNVKQRQLL